MSVGKVAFVGAGRWALALAGRFHDQGAEAALWEVSPENLRRILATRRHPDLPENRPLPEVITVSNDLRDTLENARFVIFATPAAALTGAARQAAPHIGPWVDAVVTVTKGIDPETLKRFSVLLSETVSGTPVVVLAGPGIPYDFADGDPTSLVAASEDHAAAELVRDTLTDGNLRLYSSSDVVGVEIGAAFKNVIALAGGIADGLGLGLNAKAALLTRGLAEITRLGLALNANPLTFAGLSGMGDVIVTAFSSHSRNHTLGELIGRGLEPEAARARLNGVAEGATAAETARRLALRHHVDMPIAEEVYRIVHQGSQPRRSLERLLRREPKKET